MEQVGEKAFNELKEKIEMDMKQDWEAEKRKFERDLQEKHEGQNAINLQIEESKTQVNKLERKIKEVEGQHRLVETALEDCLADKKIKLKELSEQRLMNHSNAQQQMEDLETENRNKDAELAKIQKNLRDRKDLLERPSAIQTSKPLTIAPGSISHEAFANNYATEMRFENLKREVQMIKVKLATMTEVQKKEMLFSKVTSKKPLIDFESEIRTSQQPILLDYSIEEMLTQVEFDLPMKKETKEKLDNERVLIKQLLANIERNRVKWRKDVFEGDSLSTGRKVALHAVKDRID